ncbi:polysaccharide deacetylase family protein [Flaviaesturariibacter aridisoli]|uniref:NodB homology domain-containing protein n=1 Tax=Flaviaesturariibacter aridisoli TaxID=2545761 RepID=A0A4R4E785_9BACT|nr:polysaccharide deacetylase family protein [Flaviaesturariibacter aridisoli]TCZ74783.1 hypothetical protein E0486_00325 [Flaviaesturariibacter aridisoli]
MTSPSLGKSVLLNAQKNLLLLPVAQCVLPLVLLRAVFHLAGHEIALETETTYVLYLYSIVFINTGLEMYAVARLLFSADPDRERARIASPILLVKACLWLPALAGGIACCVRYADSPIYNLVTLTMFSLLSASLLLPAWLDEGSGRLAAGTRLLLLHLSFCAAAIVLTHLRAARWLLPPLAVAYALLTLWRLGKGLRKARPDQTHSWAALLSQFLKNGASSPVKYWIANQLSVSILLVAAYLLVKEDAWLFAGAINVFLLEQALFLFPIIAILLPFIQVAFSRSRRDGLERLQRILPYIIFLSLAAALSAFFLAEKIVTHYLGIHFAASTTIVSMMSPVLFFHLTNTLLGTQLLLIGDEKRICMRFLGFGFIVNFSLLLLFAKLWHGNGVAVAFAIAEVLQFAGYLLYLSQQQDPDAHSGFMRPGQIANNLLHTLSERASRYPHSLATRLAFRYGLLVEATRQIETEKRLIYLTFDDGPDPVGTPFVLEQLQLYDARATFFCLGSAVAQYPEIYARIRFEGHAVGNHTHSHLDSWKTPSDTYIADVNEAARLIDSPLFRPPYGHINRSRMQYLQCKGHPLQLVLWSVDSKDYDKGITPEQCFQNVASKAGPGSIILCHDILSSAGHIRVVLPRLLQHFTALGYRFEAIPIAAHQVAFHLPAKAS